MLRREMRKTPARASQKVLHCRSRAQFAQSSLFRALTSHQRQEVAFKTLVLFLHAVHFTARFVQSQRQPGEVRAAEHIRLLIAEHLVFQSLPVDGVIVVTSPQDLVSMIVTKAVNMAKMMDIPVLGLVENYSYFQCPDCGKRHAIFGESHLDQVAAELEVPVLAKLPMDPALAAAFDAGQIEDAPANYMEELATRLDG